MGKAPDLEVDLTQAGKEFCDIREMLNTVFGDKALKKALI